MMKLQLLLLCVLLSVLPDPLLVAQPIDLPIGGQHLPIVQAEASSLTEDLRVDLRLLRKNQQEHLTPYPETVRFDLEETSELKLAATGLIRFYQKFISTQDLPACNFTPSCSRFGMRAIQESGVTRGILLTADRLIRDNGCLLDLYYPHDPITGKFSDPVARYVGRLERETGKQGDGEQPPNIQRSNVQRSSQQSANVDYDALENLLRFADYLYGEGDYLRAAGEYQRYLFRLPDAPTSVRIRTAHCYYLGGRPDRALQFLETQLRDARTEEARAEFRYALAETHFLLGEYDPSLTLLGEPVPAEKRYPYRQLSGLNYLKQGHWTAAHDLFTQLAEESTTPKQAEQAELYRQYALDGMHLPRKHPWLAGVLSALLPGAGRLYLGRTNDALMTVFVLGITGWQAYDGFSEGGRSSAKGWIYGTLAGTFYLGNVYGSVIGARLQNRDAEAALLLSIPLPE